MHVEDTGLGETDQLLRPLLVPIRWKIVNALLPQPLAEAKDLIGVHEGIGRVLPNPAILLRPTEDREAIQYSALEGTCDTPRQLLVFELDRPNVATENDEVNRFREVPWRSPAGSCPADARTGK